MEFQSFERKKKNRIQSGITCKLALRPSKNGQQLPTSAVAYTILMVFYKCVPPSQTQPSFAWRKHGIKFPKRYKILFSKSISIQNQWWPNCIRHFSLAFRSSTPYLSYNQWFVRMVAFERCVRHCTDVIRLAFHIWACISLICHSSKKERPTLRRMACWTFPKCEWFVLNMLLN